MKRMIFILLSALLLAALPTQQAVAELILHETVTITLDDGTAINLILSNSNARVNTTGNNQLRPLNFGYLQNKTRNDLAEDFKKNRDHTKGQFLWQSSRLIPTKNYYYLPPPPRVSTKPDGTPEFLFVKFTTDVTEEEGGVTGGLLHFLAEYGLTPAQERELERKLEQKIQGARLLGAVPMEAGPGESTFEVISGTLASDRFTDNLVASGRAPLMPGQKVAVAATLSQYGATLLEETLKKPTSDISITFNLAYTAHTPAFTGKITYNWDKVRTQKEFYMRRYREKKSGFWFWESTDAVRDTEIQLMWDFMTENEIVKIEATEGIVDERVEAIRQAFMDTMTDWFLSKERIAITDEDENEELKAGDSMKAKSENYRGIRYRVKKDMQYVNRTQTITWKLPVRVEYSTTGNINGGWYLENKENHPQIFSEINLDDPFFQRRLVIFNLDLDAAEIFDDAINHVTVEVRKKRDSGRDFSDSVTIDKKYLEENGVSARMTYAKMREDDPQEFEYMVRWSLRGGVDYPASPSWKNGSWEGVTLAPPIRPFVVEAEADLLELEENDIVRATVQLRYKKFGKTYEDPTALQLSVTRGEAIDDHMIFRDIGEADFDYMVTYYHKRKGRIRTNWTRGTQDGYIFCVLPDELRQETADE